MIYELFSLNNIFVK